MIAYAYDGRVSRLGLKEYFRSRLIRLHPLVVMGSVLGLVGFFIEGFVGPGFGGPVQTIDGWRIAEGFLCSILMIPFPVMASRFYNNFGYNAPAWSLFWEYIASLFYGLFLYRIGRRYLVVLTVLAAGGIVWVVYKEGSLLGGWSGGTFGTGWRGWLIHFWRVCSSIGRSGLL
ncbi:hypothetical protein ACQ86N_34190 [Puia sp. P3]|uniref:hypothetical protein n=1 Tax=Puia sp. P3 TaxID=3423952 RepID=UPI003D6791AB